MTLTEYNDLLADHAKEHANKFKAKRTKTSDGQWCDSKAEARRYEELLLMQRSGEISDLAIHPRYPLEVNGIDVSRYTADFRYLDHGIVVVEDVKSPITRKQGDYIIRKKLMKALYKIDITEVS